jgi:uncharacterized protein YndB with AHSA1/START domain
MKITVETIVKAPLEDVWRAYTSPADIAQWNAASDDWHTTKATVDLRKGGAFSSRMEAKDGSMGFDFAGIYTEVVEHKRIAYAFGDRNAEVDFVPEANGIVVRVTFDSEPSHSIEQQRDGWQAILDNFAKHVQAKQGRSGKVVVDASSERDFVATRQFTAPARIVFEAWTNPELFRQWWVPKSCGLSLLSCTMDIRTGGQYRLEFRHPSSEQPMAFFGRYIEVTPPARLVWTNDEGGGAVTTVTFDEADGETTVAMRDHYPSKAARDDAIASGSTSGIAEQFEQLETLVTDLSASHVQP